MKQERFSDIFKRYRVKKNPGLTSWCREHSLDQGNHSKLERGIMPPPQNFARLHEYIEIFEIEEFSDDWHNFLNLALIENLKLPLEHKPDRNLAYLISIFFTHLQGFPLKDSDKELLRNFVAKDNNGLSE
jgi:hypothetical protein